MNRPLPLEYRSRPDPDPGSLAPDPGFLMSTSAVTVLITAVGIATTVFLNVFSSSTGSEVLQWFGLGLLSITMLILELFAFFRLSSIAAFILGIVLLLTAALFALAVGARGLLADLVVVVPLTLSSAGHFIWAVRLHTWKRSLKQ